MISIARKELDNYHYLNSGTFGSVYQVDDSTCYKIYHPYVRNSCGEMVKNPNLKQIHWYSRFLKKNAKLAYSCIFSDYLLVDGEFAGVVLPYYTGITFDKMMNAPFFEKSQLIEELVRNAKELTSHYIYPCDYKLNNLISNFGHTKIIDLDDTFTKSSSFMNPIYLKKSVTLLNETIRDFLDEYQYRQYSAFFKRDLERGFWPECTNYHELDSYLKERCSYYHYILCDQNSDLSYLENLISDQNRFLYLYPNGCFRDDYFQEILFDYQKHHIPLYDFIHESDLTSFCSNHGVLDYSIVKEKRLIKK